MKQKKSNNLEHKFIADCLSKILKTRDNFSREYVIFKRLLKLYPDKQIWLNIDVKVDSFLFFYSDYGRNYIRRIINNLAFQMEKPKPIELNDKKIGEDKIINKKPKTISEFLN